MINQLLRIYNKKSSTKGELRQALGLALQGLGVKITLIDTPTPASVFSELKTVWIKAYHHYTGLEYAWSAKDSGALKQIEKKLPEGNKREAFRMLLWRLPDWYKNHGMSVTVINGKYNEIVAAIKRNNDEQSKSVRDDYEQQVIRDLLS